ncbi:MAG: ABC transporter ATP-binding protein, partial [Clostridia bacterium]|nr:ABC transporter ATP-binding protein [Clostridia bacterium]
MIEIKNLTVNYGLNTVYKNLDLTVEDKKITCVLGESGCGKTTLLNAVAGLISYDGTVSAVNPAYVFQTPRLLPYLTVLKNLTVVGADADAALNMLERVGMGYKAGAYVHTLSGGEAQRVALCRAFLFKSDALLLDEPFSSLDLKTKISVMELFKSLQSENGLTTLFVTHDADEAVFLADKIVVISRGKISKTFENEKKPPYGAN